MHKTSWIPRLNGWNVINNVYPENKKENKPESRDTENISPNISFKMGKNRELIGMIKYNVADKKDLIKDKVILSAFPETFWMPMRKSNFPNEIPFIK